MRSAIFIRAFRTILLDLASVFGNRMSLPKTEATSNKFVRKDLIKMADLKIVDIKEIPKKFASFMPHPVEYHHWWY